MSNEANSESQESKADKGMRRDMREQMVGLFFAVALAVAFFLFEAISGGKYVGGGKTVIGYFDDVQELQVGAAVKKAGVQIGRVESINLEATNVKVTFRMDKGADLRTDSVASIEFKGLLGENYVSVTFGTEEVALAEGATIQTREQPDLSALMARLDNVASGVENITRSFSGDSIQNVLGPLTDFMKDNNPKITKIFDNLDSVTTQMKEGQGTVGKLLSDDSLFTSTKDAIDNMNATAEDIKTALADVKPIIAKATNALSSAELALEEAKTTLTEARKVVVDIGEGKGSLGKLAKDEALYAETVTAMNNLKAILEKINMGQGSVGKVVNDESLYNNAKATLQKVEKATESLEDTGPLNVLGTAVGRLF